MKPTEDKEARLTDEEIANALQPVCENEAKTYYTADATAITCINCNPVAKAQVAKLEELGYHRKKRSK